MRDFTPDFGFVSFIADKSKRNAGSCIALNNYNLGVRVKKGQTLNLILDPFAQERRKNASSSDGSTEKAASPASGAAVTPVGKIVKALMEKHAPTQRTSRITV